MSFGSTVHVNVHDMYKTCSRQFSTFKKLRKQVVKRDTFYCSVLLRTFNDDYHQTHRVFLYD